MKTTKKFIDKMRDMDRLTVDMTKDEHVCLKLASISCGISMRRYVLLAVFRDIQKIENAEIAEMANKILSELYQFEK